MLIPAQFQPPSSTGRGGKRGDRHTTPYVTPFLHDPHENHSENSKRPPSLCLEGIVSSNSYLSQDGRQRRSDEQKPRFNYWKYKLIVSENTLP